MAILAVGFGTSENIGKLAAYQDDNAIPWPFAEGPPDMARDFNVSSQATKLGIGADGVIQFGGGYNSGPGSWPDVLATLAGSG